MYIKSPLNYTGNKYRILNQILKHIPKVETFVDLFCGGATVGFNVDANKIYLVDNNIKVINLLKFLAQNEVEDTINKIEKYIERYNLSYSYKFSYSFYKENGYVDGNNGLKPYNFEGFYRLRKDYNFLKNKNTKKANIMLYLLMVYGFNNDLRFNSKGEYNLPIGKTDFNKNNYKKLVNFYERAKKINYKFICGDFRNELIQKIILEADYVYADPPYLITKAVYNENGGWSAQHEKELLLLLNKRRIMNKSFAISNVISKKSSRNLLLTDFLNKNEDLVKININYHYRSSSYNKKNRDESEEEVLIIKA